MIYFIVDIILGINYPIQTILLSFVGWDSIGNSNWFVFDTLLLYLCTSVAFYISRIVSHEKKTIILTIVTTVMTCAIIVFLYFFKSSWWYNTLLGFPCGMLFYLLKNKVDLILNKNVLYCFTGGGLLVAFVVTYLIGNAIMFNICSCLFCLLICWFTYKIRISNRVLIWLGKYSFYIYIYMRIPMLIMEHYEFINNIYLFSVVSLITTVLIACGMGDLQPKIDKLLFERSE